MSNNVTITLATPDHIPYITANDAHISAEELRHSVERGRVLVLTKDSTPVGHLRWNLFWDNTPFMNMLKIAEAHRRNGLGRTLVTKWESLMKSKGCPLVMTSTQSDEDAQHFYRKLGYADAGVLLLKGEAAEILFTKEM